MATRRCEQRGTRSEFKNIEKFEIGMTFITVIKERWYSWAGATEYCHCTGKDQRTFGDCRSNSAAVTSQGYKAMEEPAWVVVELKQPKVFRLGSLFLCVIFPGLDARPRLADLFRSFTALRLHE